MTIADYQPFVERMIQRYEGGYGWDAADPGGPTKYGITCYDLAEHRHQTVTSMAAWAPLVKAMTLDEADADLRAASTPRPAASRTYRPAATAWSLTSVLILAPPAPSDMRKSWSELVSMAFLVRLRWRQLIRMTPAISSTNYAIGGWSSCADWGFGIHSEKAGAIALRTCGPIPWDYWPRRSCAPRRLRDMLGSRN